MSVTNYNNSTCKYRIPKLDDVVYLISESQIGKISIDNGDAYIDSISGNPLKFKAYGVTLSDNDALDERYKFEHSVSFSVLGYKSYEDLQGLYYVLVQDVEGTIWLMNPQFPSKVTYTYTLDSSQSHTDFTLSTISNYPTLRVKNLDLKNIKECDGYVINGVDSLMLNESKYSAREGSKVAYTNDGFKTVGFLKDSCTFTENFDGDNVTHSISFKIDLDSYKDSWHYNLLEFTENTYAAIVKTKGGKVLMCGFGYGLQPSFTVNGTSTESNYIQVDMSDMHNDGTFLSEGDYSMEGDDRVRWEYTKEYGFDCMGRNVARYTLMKEVNAFGAETGRYKCLEGFEEYYKGMGLNIIGTFTGNQLFNEASCMEASCQFQSSMPSTIIFNVKGCKKYYVICGSNWNIKSNDAEITVNPSNGVANMAYEVEICSLVSPNTRTFRTTLDVEFCDGQRKSYGVSVEAGNPCFTAGQVFDITANAQYVLIPSMCCVQAATEATNTIVDIQISTNIIKVFVPQNSTGIERSFTLDVTFCDGTKGTVTINQSNGFEKWVTVRTECNSIGQKCELQQLYTGTTADNINTPTTTTRYANCVNSPECGSYVKWTETTDTYCENGEKYYVEKEEVSYDLGQTWQETGYQRLGRKTEDSPAECEFETSYQYQWFESDMTTCLGFDKYKLYIYRRKSNNSDVWVDVIPTRVSYDAEGTQPPILVEKNSADCGYMKPVEPIYDWVLNEDGFLCEECEGYSERWVKEDIEDGYECNGTAKHYVERLEISTDGSNWFKTSKTRVTDEVYDECSYDCGCLELNPSDDTKYMGLYGKEIFEIKYPDCEGELHLNGYNTFGRTWISPSNPNDLAREYLLSAYVGERCTYIDEALFDGCVNLKKLVIDAPIKSYPMYFARDCRSLDSLDIDLSIITDVGHGAFQNTKLKGKLNSPFLRSVGENAFENTLIEEVLIPIAFRDGIISPSAFANCKNLKKITIEESSNRFGVSVNAFYGSLSQITRLDIPNNVTNIQDSAFGGCYNLEELYIGTGLTDLRYNAFIGIGTNVKCKVYLYGRPTINRDFLDANVEIIYL